MFENNADQPVPAATRITPVARRPNPWHALWAMLVGFFMILVDSTIVAVANKRIMEVLHTDYDGVIWVTSAYLLGFAVPLLVAGRLGDRFGPKNLYLIGLAVFTAASLWCGLAGSIEMLIAARVVQGLGAALLTPQTLSMITRIFPAAHRGVAMSVWGATAGVATLVGPLAGGVLVDGLGWQWIFFVNVPIGVIGLGLAIWLVPALPTEKHHFDLLGVALSGLAMFFIVFGLQEGQSHDWAPWIWAMIATGAALMVVFIYWQSVNPREPLIPLRIFADRDFTLSAVGVAVIGFAVTAMILPVMFYAPVVLGLSYTRSALLTAPMAIASGLLAPLVGRIVDRSHPTPIIGFGFSVIAIALTWLSIEMTPTTAIWRLLLPLTALGVGMAFVWSPLAATATRNLPPELAGAGSGVYNTTRQVGAVLGSAAMAAVMTWRIGAELPGSGQPVAAEGQVAELPAFLHPPFSAALSDSLLLPAFVALFGVAGAIFLRGFGDGARTETEDPIEPVLSARVPEVSAAAQHSVDEQWVDDDDYVEYTVDWSQQEEPWESADPDEPDAFRRFPGLAEQPTDVVAAVRADEPRETYEPYAPDEPPTDPLPAYVGHPLHAPADAWRGGPVETWQRPAPEPDTDPEPAWRSILDDLLGEPADDQIGHARNGFHTDTDNRFQQLQPPAPLHEVESEGRHSRSSGGRHARED